MHCKKCKARELCQLFCRRCNPRLLECSRSHCNYNNSEHWVEWHNPFHNKYHRQALWTNYVKSLVHVNQGRGSNGKGIAHDSNLFVRYVYAVSFTVQRLCRVLEASTLQHKLVNEPKCIKLQTLSSVMAIKRGLLTYVRNICSESWYICVIVNSQDDVWNLRRAKWSWWKEAWCQKGIFTGIYAVARPFLPPSNLVFLLVPGRNS